MDSIEENHDSGSTRWNFCLLCGSNSPGSPNPDSCAAAGPVAIDKLARACCKMFKLPVKQWYDELRGAGAGDTELGHCYCEPCTEILHQIHVTWAQLNELHIKIGELHCQVVATLQNVTNTDGVDVSPRIGLTRKKLIKALKPSRKLYEVDPEALALAAPIDIKIEEEDHESMPSSPITDQLFADEDYHDFVPPPSLVPQSPESHSSELGESPPEEAKVKKRRKKRVRSLSPSTIQRLTDEIHSSQRQLYIPLKRVRRCQAEGRWILPRFKYSQPPGYTSKWKKYKHGFKRSKVAQPARSKLKKKKTTPKAVRPSFVCEVCSKTYFFEIRFKRHLLRHQSDSETPKEKELSAKVEYLCRFCGKTFHSQYYTQTHELFQHGSGNITGGPQLWKCTWPGCKYHCFGLYRFKLHEAGHKNERNYRCTVKGCGKTFIHKKGLAGHMFIHTGQRPYKCTQDGCEAAFRALKHLQNHTKVIHEKAETFRCELCGAGFPIRKYLLRHLEKHAKGKI